MPMSKTVMDAVDLVEAGGQLGPFPVPLVIAGPPCVLCGNWLPQVQTDSTGRQIMVTLCDANHLQRPDFSCYDPPQVIEVPQA